MIDVEMNKSVTILSIYPPVYLIYTWAELTGT